jgi:phosphopantothenoylcysteine decarboxylase/phosphopantothenate--cysteine ligase
LSADSDVNASEHRPSENRHVLLGVSGGIAAYKACEVVRRLRDAGAEVRVVMTKGAERFVTPLTFHALSGQPVRGGLWDEAAEMGMGHLELARWADAILIAPASADMLARLAHGFADDLLSTLCLAATAPIAVAPAMNHRMWLHPATQANVASLRQRGVAVLGPANGPLAEGESGPGRMLEPQQLVQALLVPGGTHVA